MELSAAESNGGMPRTGGNAIAVQKVKGEQPMVTFTVQSYNNTQPLQINGIQAGLNTITLQPNDLSAIALQPIFYENYNNQVNKVSDYKLVGAKVEPDETPATEANGFEVGLYRDKPSYPLPSILDGELFKVLSQDGDKISAKCRVCPPSKKPIRGTRLSTGNFLSHILRCHPSLKNRVEEKRRERRAGKRHSTTVVQQPSDEFYTNRWHQTLQAQNNNTTAPSSPTHAVTEPVVTITETENRNGNMTNMQQVYLQSKDELSDDNGTQPRSRTDHRNYINVVNMDTLTAANSANFTMTALHGSDKHNSSTNDRALQERESAANERIVAALERRARAAEKRALAEEAIADATQRKAAAEERIADAQERIATVVERQAELKENQLGNVDVRR